MFWNWIRQQVKLAVLAGVEDAAAELEGPVPGEMSNAITSLRRRVLAIESDGEADVPKKKAKAA